MSVVTAQARRATGLLLAGLLLTFIQPRKTRGPEVQLYTHQSTGSQDGWKQKNDATSANLSSQIPPSNTSGTYRGMWERQQYGTDADTVLLSHKMGMVVFKLSAYPSLRSGVRNLQGELILRDGAYASDADVLFRVQGVYVVEVGKMIAVLDPITPVVLPVPTQDAQHLTEYRESLRTAAASYLSFTDSGTGFRADAGIVQGTATCQFAAELIFGLDKYEDDLLGKATSKAQGKANVMVNGTIFSSNCGVSLHVNASATEIESYYAKAINYTIMVTVLAFVQIMLLVKQMEASNTQALASKVSLLTIAQQAVLDAYLCLLHLTVGIMVEPLFNAFATAAFFEFVIFAIFEMRFLLLVWRARRSGTVDPWTAQRELSILYGRFYGALLGGILLSYYLQRFMKIAVVLLYSFWLPQIVLCIRNDCRQPLKPLYVVGMSLARLALPLYMYCCPGNLLRIAPSPALCVGLVLFVGVQAGVLLLQHLKGPRCIIPKRFLPPKYNYHQAASRIKSNASFGHPDIETGEGLVECVICMNPVNVMELSQRMVTPCCHFFHPQCLQRWMDVKLECPTCRHVLPPV